MRPIHISLSPNLEWDDVKLSARLLAVGARGGEVEKVEEYFRGVAFNAGRSALWAILKAARIGEGDEVVIQAFTCVAVPNSVKWAGAKPVYADIKFGTYNMDSTDLEKKITKRTRAVVVQHTFGIPADLDEIGKICKKNKLIMIEDCAHALGAIYRGKKVGSFGDAAFYSFGRDKVISSVFGGMAVANDKDLFKKLRKVQQDLPESSGGWIKQQLMHPIISWVALQTYGVGLGKVILKMAQIMKLVSLAVYPEEKRGIRPGVFPAKYDDRLAALALNQLKKLERFNERRRQIAKMYGKVREGAIYMRYPVEVERRDGMNKAMFGDWYRHVVEPVDDDEVTGYISGTCPVAEEAAKKVINLPTCPYLTDGQVEKVKEVWSKLKR